MIDHKANLSKPRSDLRKLFVAGFPSGTNYQIVIHFFKRISPCITVSTDEGDDHASRMAQKGCYFIICPDSVVAHGLVHNKYLSFMGRTLTVMPHKSGVDLIIQNKKLKKRRVILKRVPWFVEEHHLRKLLETSFGPLQLFFQLRHDNLNKKQVSTAKFTKFKSYSAYFINLNDAKRLAAQGTIALEDGTVIAVHRYPEHKSNLPQLDDPSSDTPAEKREAKIAPKGGKGQNEDPLGFRPAPINTSGGEPNKVVTSAFHHRLKPTQKHYYCVSELGKARTFYDLAKSDSRYRFNKKTMFFF